MKFIIFFSWLFISANLSAQNMYIESIISNDLVDSVGETFYFKTTNIKGRFRIVFDQVRADSLIYLLSDETEGFVIKQNLQQNGNKMIGLIEYDFQKDAPFQKIYYSLDGKKESLNIQIFIDRNLRLESNDIEIMKSSVGKIEVVGDSINLIRVTTNLNQKTIDGCYSYQFLKDNKLKKIYLEISNLKDTITQDYIITVPYDNYYIKNYKKENKKEVQQPLKVTLKQSANKNINYLGNLKIFDGCTQSSLIFSIEGFSLPVNTTLDILDESSKDTVAKYFINRVESTNIYSGTLITYRHNSDKLGTRVLTTKFGNTTYSVKDLVIFQKPKVNSVTIKSDNIKSKIDNLERGKRYHVEFEGENLDQLNFSTPIGISKLTKIIDSKIVTFSFDVNCDSPNKLAFRSPDKNECYNPEHDLIVKNAPSNKLPKQLLSVSTKNYGDYEIIDFYINNIVEGDLKEIKIEFKSDILDDSCSRANYYLNEKFYLKLNLPNGNLMIDSFLIHGKDKIMPIVFPLTSTSINDEEYYWSSIYITIEGEDKINYTFLPDSIQIRKSRKSTWHLRPFSISTSPVAYSIKSSNYFIPALISAFSTFGVNFYKGKKNEINPRAESLISSIDFSPILFSVNSGGLNFQDNLKSDTSFSNTEFASLITFAINPFSINRLQNDTKFSNSEWKFQIGLGYLWKNKSPFIMAGFGFSIQSLKNLSVKKSPSKN